MGAMQYLKWIIDQLSVVSTAPRAGLVYYHLLSLQVLL